MANFQPPPLKSLIADAKGAMQEPWMRWFSSLVDFLNRPRINRVSLNFAAYSAPNNSNEVSTGQGCGPITPQRYGELFLTGYGQGGNNTSGDPLRLRIRRTTGAIPPAGAAPGGADTVVWLGGVAQSGGDQERFSIAVFDKGLSVSTAYKYYATIDAVGAGIVSLAAIGSLDVSEF